MNDNVSILIINSSFHHKNKNGLQKILEKLNWYYKFGTEKDIEKYNIIYSPSQPINTSNYPTKKFIFGPHFSVFPDNKFNSLNKE